MKSINYYLSPFVLLLFQNFGISQNAIRETTRDWTALYQKIILSNETEQTFRLTGYGKAIGCDGKSGGAFWVRINSEDEGLLFFDNMVNSRIVEPRWQEFEISGVIVPRAETFHFGILVIGSGEFYFDDLQLYIIDTNGEEREVEIENGNFEISINSDIVPGWTEGISDERKDNIKGYTFENSTDTPYSGKALLIRGDSDIYVPKSYTKIEYDNSDHQQIDALIIMLEDLKSRVEKEVVDLSQAEIDHLHDHEANSIAALVLHLAAVERYYQVLTFENRRFNEEEDKFWSSALYLGDTGRSEIKGNEVQHYLDLFAEVRRNTITELKKRNDTWLQQETEGISWNNYYTWFHVMEHQSSHLGQIKFLKKRLPPKDFKD